MNYQAHFKASSIMKALKMALSNRKYAHQLVHHSDRGLQYCSYEYTDLLKKHISVWVWQGSMIPTKMPLQKEAMEY